MRWIIDGVDDLKRVAKEFLEFTGKDTIYALYGPMGVGKAKATNQDGKVAVIAELTFAVGA